MKLTKLEADILAHRLDALACYPHEDLANLFPEHSPEDVEFACDLILDWGSNKIATAVEHLGPVGKAVVAECVNGGVWLAASRDCVGHPVNSKEFAAHRRAARSLADKVQELTGIACEYPVE
jgi:hypothetical protein